MRKKVLFNLSNQEGFDSCLKQRCSEISRIPIFMSGIHKNIFKPRQYKKCWTLKIFVG